MGPPVLLSVNVGMPRDVSWQGKTVRTGACKYPVGLAGTGPAVTFARSGITVPFSPAWRSVLELADACDVPTRGAAGPAAAIPASLPCSPARSATPRIRWKPRPTETCSSAALSPAPTSSSTCKARPGVPNS
jgi:hypothetical protein